MLLTVRNTIVAAAVAVPLAVGGIGVAAAAPAAPHTASPNVTATVYKGCVTGTSRTMEHVYSRTSPPACPLGSFRATWNQTGPRGPQGIQGIQGVQGQQGVQGPSGVVSVNSTDLLANSGTQDPTADAPFLMNSGGSFNASSTLISTVNLAAGTYEVSLDYKGTAESGTGITPQLFIYNQAKNPGFTGNLFNVGAGDLQAAGTNHDSFYSGDTILTIPSGGETLFVYGFGYDEDSGSGTWNLDTATLNTVQLNPGS